MRGQMLRYATAILHSTIEAEDAVSEVMERLWRGHERLDTQSNVTAFVMTSVRNSCYDAVRKRRGSEELTERTQSTADISRLDNIELVRYAMRHLKEREREVIHLKDIEGYSTDEIAAIYTTTEVNIRMILSRGRKSLREEIVKIMQV